MGTVLNAEISKELIQSVFFPNSPLHDGAVIIKENNLFAAGCILPITKQENLDQRFGSRHRAALGLSEETDALVIIVSEESGRISIADTGILKVDLSAREIEDYIKKRFSEK
jgi:diadenylate cyclase